MDKIYGNLDISASEEYIRVKFRPLELKDYNLIKNKKLTIASHEFEIYWMDIRKLYWKNW